MRYALRYFLRKIITHQACDYYIFPEDEDLNPAGCSDFDNENDFDSNEQSVQATGRGHGQETNTCNENNENLDRNDLDSEKLLVLEEIENQTNAEMVLNFIDGMQTNNNMNDTSDSNNTGTNLFGGGGCSGGCGGAGYQNNNLIKFDDAEIIHRNPGNLFGSNSGNASGVSSGSGTYCADDDDEDVNHAQDNSNPDEYLTNDYAIREDFCKDEDDNENNNDSYINQDQNDDYGGEDDDGDYGDEILSELEEEAYRNEQNENDEQQNEGIYYDDLEQDSIGGGGGGNNNFYGYEADDFDMTLIANELEDEAEDFFGDISNQDFNGGSNSNRSDSKNSKINGSSDDENDAGSEPNEEGPGPNNSNEPKEPPCFNKKSGGGGGANNYEGGRVNNSSSSSENGGEGDDEFDVNQANEDDEANIMILAGQNGFGAFSGGFSRSRFRSGGSDHNNGQNDQNEDQDPNQNNYNPEPNLHHITDQLISNRKSNFTSDNFFENNTDEELEEALDEEQYNNLNFNEGHSDQDEIDDEEAMFGEYGGNGYGMDGCEDSCVYGSSGLLPYDDLYGLEGYGNGGSYDCDYL